MEENRDEINFLIKEGIIKTAQIMTQKSMRPIFKPQKIGLDFLSTDGAYSVQTDILLVSVIPSE